TLTFQVQRGTYSSPNPSKVNKKYTFFFFRSLNCEGEALGKGLGIVLESVLSQKSSAQSGNQICDTGFD
ncbi:MAG: hypothetical protein ACP5RH_19025, partial [Leptodesmis sp.]|uniref:hypothetical protein n=1 Tax=Leptodesmis sp. TaxID=3100501 RepID=UPI003D0E95BB